MSWVKWWRVVGVVGLVLLGTSPTMAGYQAVVSIDGAGKDFVLVPGQAVVKNVYISLSSDLVDAVNERLAMAAGNGIAMKWALTFGYTAQSALGETVVPCEAANVTLDITKPISEEYPSLFDYMSPLDPSSVYPRFLFRDKNNTYNYPLTQNEWDMLQTNMYDKSRLVQTLDSSTFFLGQLTITQNSEWTETGTRFQIHDEFVHNSGGHVTSLWLDNIILDSHTPAPDGTIRLVIGDIPSVPEPTTWTFVAGMGIVGMGVYRRCRRRSF